MTHQLTWVFDTASGGVGQIVGKHERLVVLDAVDGTSWLAKRTDLREATYEEIVSNWLHGRETVSKCEICQACLRQLAESLEAGDYRQAFWRTREMRDHLDKRVLVI